jgi:glutamate racemase
MSVLCSPIGVFDSGVGGLSVLQEVRTRLPWEDLLYIADSKHVPYGNKSPEYILQRCRQLTDFLLGQGAKAIVIACNTATVGAVAALRAERPGIPIIGMEPAVKPAVAASNCGRIGVLATVGTLQSAQFAALLDKFAGSVRVITQPAPGLVECVEAGDLDSPETTSLAAQFVAPLVAAHVDVIVLGCTHYPFLRPLIQRLAGPEITLIDTGNAVARQVESRLRELHLLQTSPRSSLETFYTSGDPTESQRALRVLWPSAETVHRLPDSVANMTTSV